MEVRTRYIFIYCLLHLHIQQHQYLNLHPHPLFLKANFRLWLRYCTATASFGHNEHLFYWWILVQYETPAQIFALPGWIVFPVSHLSIIPSPSRHHRLPPISPTKKSHLFYISNITILYRTLLAWYDDSILALVVVNMILTKGNIFYRVVSDI